MSPDGKSFSDWDLDSEIADAISNKGWTIPTDIQVEAIPVARAGRDVVGQARTGSGKTAAFGIPIIEACQATGSPQAIVLCPTRELAVQVAEEISWLQGGLGMSVQTVYGGTDIEKQAKLLDKGADIIVGTPGRVIDMAKRGHLKLADIRRFCLDEADRMLDMGFFPDVLWIFDQMPAREQTMLFSATFPQEVLDAAEEFMDDPVFVMSDDLEVEIPEIEQFAVRIGRPNKLWVLGRLIANMSEDDQMLIFTNTKRMVDLLEERLSKFGMRAVGLHGDKAQNRREKILDSFRDGRERIVVATDVAARGLDVDGITHVADGPNLFAPVVVEAAGTATSRTWRRVTRCAMSATRKRGLESAAVNDEWRCASNTERSHGDAPTAVRTTYAAQTMPMKPESKNRMRCWTCKGGRTLEMQRPTMGQPTKITMPRNRC